ncbi:tubulin-like doman-containing protein [Actinomyces procaprae]|uniref:tubulin-like doman-containing protein n=1 Tax=Actinomyces procaprae TaxID=2560010 RepID=UPI0010A24296|nr:tubulin-like doman-containing protein [Actinomyces procaprae]
MYKVLVIGCGGSGAKTLAYMMDQLRADLAVHGIGEIPECWQFLNVDTPLQEEAGENVGTVSQQGGAYVACGVASGAYSVVDQALTGRVQQNSPAGLRHLATWMPRRPRDVAFPVTVGAGQFRGIGRLLVLTKLDEVSRAVQSCLARMADPKAQDEAARVCAKVPGAGEPPKPDAPPMVLVISSMAGGSGASMTLDVCRLVAGVQTTPAIDPQLISVFLYTAEAFGSVQDDMRTGMPGNTLAMLGEIVAAQAGAEGRAAGLDEELYACFGITGRAGRAFKRVTPIGIKAGGTGAVFGDGSAEDVFRGMGRGLARYIASPAFNDYVSYDIANGVNVSSKEYVSWGVDATDTAWSSFGYASLSTGRDRYAEYAAQRIARRCVDHVLDGFRRPGVNVGDTQALSDLWSTNRALELERIGLPTASGTNIVGVSGAADQEALMWLASAQASRVVNNDTIVSRMRDVVDGLFARRIALGDGVTAAALADALSDWLRGQTPAVSAQLEAIARDLARARAEEIAARLADTVRLNISEFGLPYALTVLDHLRRPGGELLSLAERLAGAVTQRPDTPLGLPRELSQQLASMSHKGSLSSQAQQEVMNQLRASLVRRLAQWVGCTTAVYLAPALRDMADSVVAPLETALNDARRVLEAARSDRHNAVGVADVATDLYAAWPEEAPEGQERTAVVPARFSTAHNEVVLLDVNDYPAYFSEHVRDAAPGDSDNPYMAVVRAVVTGRWAQGAGDPAPDDLLSTSGWVPRGLQLAAQGEVPTPARATVRLQPGVLLERARAFVARRGEAFEQFTSQSLRGYLNDDSVGEHARSERSAAVLAGLRRTLEMARPLVEIDPQVYARLHDGQPPRLSFTFSTIPFRNHQVADDFLDYLGHNTSFATDLVVKNAQLRLGDDDVARVDVFGSYPRTLPAAYSGLLKSVADRWDAVSGSAGGRESFWQFRRARPLPGGVPMGDDERRAIIRGWWAATLAGGIDRDPWRTATDTRPVRVWDRAEGEWVAFPAPMLTPPSRMIAPNAWLPAILESTLLAYLRIGRDGLEVFRPWSVLRRWADDGANQHQEAFGRDTPVQSMLAELLGRGAVDGLTPGVDLEDARSAEERRERLLAYCDAILADLDQNYLPGEGKADAPGHWTNFHRRELVETTPLSVDLAAEMSAELRAVREDLAQVAPVDAVGGTRAVTDGLEY